MTHKNDTSPTRLTETPGDVQVKLPLPAETSQRFAALPEWIIDDMADFMLFALQ
jgi:hypothetical protein